jgi:hypothetical protein
VVADDLNIETERVNVRYYDRHDREGQDRLDEFAEISDAGAVALEDLTSQSSHTPSIVRRCKGIAAVDGGHQANAQQFD